MNNSIKRSLSYCASAVRRYDPVGTRRMCKCLFWIVLITSLGVLQVHVRFKIRDLQMETLKLQEEKSYLLDKHNELQSEVEELRRGDRILEIAKNELGLVQYPASRLERLRISDRIVEKYESALMEGDQRDIGVGSFSAEETLLSKLAGILGIQQVSQAREY